ncbi:hypothetical protein pipiens_008523, partial [Culex pipiens pipiens]
MRHLIIPVSALFCNRFVWRRHSSQLARPFVLGIESSCDDSGAAIVSRDGTVLGEDVHSQQNNHLKFGGIIPPVAQEFHRDHIENVVQRTLDQANMSCGDLDAIAVTNRPGLPLSLLVGVRYAKHLGRKFNKPIIPIHHMEAHALMARMTNKVPFPFVCILVSGGHSLLTLVKNTKQFYLLGKTLDDAPGEAFDKIARRLKLRNLPEYAWISGGRAIELAAASSTNMAKYDFPLPFKRTNSALAPDSVLPDYNDLCAAFLNASARHIAQRTLRAIRFCEKQSLIQAGDPKTLVISGGVACNDFIFRTVSKMAESVGYVTVRPLKKHCTDNGVMIAWNGVEKFAVGQDIVFDYDSVDIVGKTPLG